MPHDLVPNRGQPAVPLAPPRPLRLVGVGHVALDHVWDVAAMPRHAVKTPAQGYRSVVGGMTANASVAAARLGAAVRIVAPVGDDFAFPVFAAHFAREGIDAGGLLRVPGSSSSTTAVLVDAVGERTIINHRGTALHSAPAVGSPGTELEFAL